jgi:hypothetical protein
MNKMLWKLAIKVISGFFIVNVCLEICSEHGVLVMNKRVFHFLCTSWIEEN